MNTLRSRLPLLLLFLLLVAGFVLLFRVRLGAGDVYPQYSSLRSDPLGTRLLHDSLQRIPGLQVERSLEPLRKLGKGRNRTLVFAGMDPWTWAMLGTEELNALDSAVRAGDRLVVLFRASMVYGKDRRWPFDETLYEKRKEELRKRREERKHADKEKSAKPESAPPAEGIGEYDGGQDDFDESINRELDREERERAKKSGAEKQDASGGTQPGQPADRDEQSPELKEGTPVDAKPAPAPAKRRGKRGEPVDPSTEMDKEEWLRRPNAIGTNRILQLWGIDMRGRWIMPRGDQPEEDGALVESEVPPGFPASLPWKSCTYFTFTKGSPWTVLYRRGTLPVLAEMKHGAGSIVVASDAYLLSNEALQKQANPDLLSWLVGNSGRVIFDEAHLGVVRDKGIASLARRYGLLPAMVLVLVAGLLYLWRETVRFVPPRDEADEVPLEFHPTASLEALLRRAVPRSRLFQTCLDTWSRQAREEDKARLARLSAKEGVGAYNAAVEALRRRPPAKQGPE